MPTDASERDQDSTIIDSYSCDLRSAEDVRAVFEKYGKGGIWGVIHVAVSRNTLFQHVCTANDSFRLKAYKAVGESTQIPLTYYAVNVAATISLLQIMSDYDCTRLVYSSSATVYGTPPVIPIPETTRLQADSPYGKSKVMSETIIDDLCHGTMPPNQSPFWTDLTSTNRGFASRASAMACHLASLL